MHLPIIHYTTREYFKEWSLPSYSFICPLKLILQQGGYTLENILLEAATSQGIWVLLFISLFLYTIKHYERLEAKQETREKEYQNLINCLTQNFAILSNIRDDIEEMKAKLNK